MGNVVGTPVPYGPAKTRGSSTNHHSSQASKKAFTYGDAVVVFVGYEVLSFDNWFRRASEHDELEAAISAAGAADGNDDTLFLR